MRKVEEIRGEIRRIIAEKGELHKSDLMKRFPEHAFLIGYALKKEVDHGEIEKLGVTRGARYVMPHGAISGSAVIRKVYKKEAQSEEEIFFELQDEFLNNYTLSDNTKHIVSYAFTEMVNNAIDHSESAEIEIRMWVHDDDLHFMVRDFGVGVFAHVMKERGLKSEREALAEITKGKVTTAPMWHSGEGIFFTSRAADVFRLSSGMLTLQRMNNGDSRLDVIQQKDAIKGTLVEFSITMNSSRHLARDVFGQFESKQDEGDFGKTEVEVRLFNKGDIHVSRSQAKRLMEGLEKFKLVVLDFESIPFIGQGFADQIFRIFVREHPGTKLVVKNTAPDVQFMIDRVRN